MSERPTSSDERARFEAAARAREDSAIAWSISAYRGDDAIEASDVVAHEEPLEIQVQGASLAVLMRTPGHDEDLALGFLLTEGIVHRKGDVLSMRHCTSVKDPEAEENILRVVLSEGVEVPLDRLRGGAFASSSCGLCGKATIESTLVRCAHLDDDTTISAATLYTLSDRLKSSQRGFAATGGLHAAGVFSKDGSLVVAREDVGRHNAVDKVIGALTSSDLDPTELVLLVSGRISFEIAQKAAVARLPVVAGISAPTSLAVRFAESAGLTLVGFLRGETMNVYTHARRIAAASSR